MHILLTISVLAEQKRWRLKGNKAQSVHNHELKFYMLSHPFHNCCLYKTFILV